MAQLSIHTELDNTQFVPGERLNGRVSWQGITGIGKAELRLFYYTSGKGTRDATVVDQREWTSPQETAQEGFSFELPEGPYSFSGTLISLIWALELVLAPGGKMERLEFTLSPTGQELDLNRYPVPPDLSKKGGLKRFVEKGRT